MAARLGAVIVFEEGTTREEAIRALRRIDDAIVITNARSMLPLDERVGLMIQDFDDDTDFPVWYLP